MKRLKKIHREYNAGCNADPAYKLSLKTFARKVAWGGWHNNTQELLSAQIWLARKEIRR